MNYPWPDLDDPGIVQGLKERVTWIRDNTDCAAILRVSSPFVHTSQYLRGFEVVVSIESEIGSVTTLINNAGHIIKKPIEETDHQKFDHLLETHVTGALALSQTVIPSMKAGGRGHILFIVSMAAFFGLPNIIAYTAAKSALRGMVRAMATELSSDGIRVNAIAPGWIWSELLQKTVEIDPERKKRVLSRTPMGKFGQAEDIGWAAVYLCSPAANFLTGVCLPVDGGISIGF